MSVCMRNYEAWLSKLLEYWRRDIVLSADVVYADSFMLLQVGIHTILHCICGLVVRVPGYSKKMNCASCEVRTESIYIM
jgi:hypothetical protein